MATDVMDLISDLKLKGEAFVLATVVRTVAVTAAKAGAKAGAKADAKAGAKTPSLTPAGELARAWPPAAPDCALHGHA